MKKLMNQPEKYVDESLAGILLAHGERLQSIPNDIRAIYAVNRPVAGKVAIVTGGGYGHLPLFLGYVGDGLCDGVAVGNVFTSPSFDSIWSVTQKVNGGAGILFLFGNYFGDRMNFSMAAEMAELEGIETATVYICDDVASAPAEKRNERRGIAGALFAYKIAGAAAAQMDSLIEVERLARKAVENTSTYGIALSSCQLPQADGPVFDIGEKEMEIGMGIHGEPGVMRSPLLTANEIAQRLVPELIKDQALTKGDRIALLVNGLGATAQEELYILYKNVAEILMSKEIQIEECFIGEYATSMEMSGASISVMKLDDELLELLRQPASTPFVQFANRS